MELPPCDGGRAGGAGEQVPAAGVHQRGRHAGAAGELRQSPLHQPSTADQVHSPDPHRRGPGLFLISVSGHEQAKVQGSSPKPAIMAHHCWFMARIVRRDPWKDQLLSVLSIVLILYFVYSHLYMLQRIKL